MRESRSSGSVEGVVSNHDPYSDCARNGDQPTSDSDRSLIAAQPDCSGEECRKDYQADPQTRAAQEMKRREVYQRMDGDATRHWEGVSFRAAAQARLEHGGEMRSVEGNLLDHADRDQR